MMAVLKTEKLKSYYELDNFGIKQVVKAVDDVSIELHENEIYGIAGESGCGKTTIIKTIWEEKRVIIRDKEENYLIGYIENIVDYRILDGTTDIKVILGDNIVLYTDILKIEEDNSHSIKTYEKGFSNHEKIPA